MLRQLQLAPALAGRAIISEFEATALVNKALGGAHIVSAVAICFGFLSLMT